QPAVHSRISTLTVMRWHHYTEGSVAARTIAKVPKIEKVCVHDVAGPYPPATRLPAIVLWPGVGTGGHEAAVDRESVPYRVCDALSPDLALGNTNSEVPCERRK